MSLFVAGAVLGEGQVSLFVTGAVLGEGQVSLFVTGAVLGEGPVSLFVAGAVLGEGPVSWCFIVVCHCRLRQLQSRVSFRTPCRMSLRTATWHEQGLKLVRLERKKPVVVLYFVVLA